MAALWILGILLALIVAALFLRVGVRIAFGQELRVTAAAGPVRMQIVPRPPKKPKKQKKHKEKKNPPEKQKAAPREKRKLGLTPGDIRSALPYLWQSLQGGLRKTRQRLRIDPMQVSVILGGEEDPGGVCRGLRLDQRGGVDVYASAGGADAYPGPVYSPGRGL